DTDHTLVEKMNNLARDMRFEEAEVIRRKLDKIHRARQEYKDTFFSVWNFNYLVILGSDSVSRCKIAFVREARVVGFEEYEVESLEQVLDADLQRFFDAPAERNS